MLPLWYPTSEPDDGMNIIHGRQTLLGAQTLEWASRTFSSASGTATWYAAYDYLLGILTAPAYARSLWGPLEVESPRIPLTQDASLAEEFRAIGTAARHAWEKDVKPTGFTWAGAAKTPLLGEATWADDTISFTNGRTISGVTEDMWRFAISGYRVLPSWFAARTHWVANMSQALQTQKTLAALRDLIAVMRDADKAFAKLAG